MSKKLRAEVRKHAKVLKKLRSDLAENLKSQNAIKAKLIAHKQHLSNKNVKKAKVAFKSIKRLNKKLKMMQRKIDKVNGNIAKSHNLVKNTKKIFKIAKRMPPEFKKNFAGSGSFGKCLTRGGGACNDHLQSQMRLIRRQKRGIRRSRKFIKEIQEKLRKKKAYIKNLKVDGHTLKKEVEDKLEKTVILLNKRFSQNK